MEEKKLKQVEKERKPKLKKEPEVIDERNDIDFGEPEETVLLKRKIMELEEQVKRIQADNINFRRRKNEEVEQRLKFANEFLIKDIIGELDNFERALKVEYDKMDKFIEGFKLIEENFLEILKNYGVEKMESLGKSYDYHLHEALATEEDLTKPDGTILEVYKEGYMLKGKIVRHAAVKVNQIKNKKEVKNE